MKGISDIMQETALDICQSKQRAIMSGESDKAKKDIISILSTFILK